MQRAVGNAVSAAYAGGLLLGLGVLFVERDYRVCVLEDRAVGVRNGNSHHGTAVEDLSGLFLEAACKVDQILNRGADRNYNVLGFLDGAAVYGNALFNKRHTCLAVPCKARQCSAVQNDCSGVQRELTLWNYRAGGVVNQNFFTALGIYARKRLYSKAGIRRCKFVHLCDALGLVLFDADDDVLYL